MPAKEIISSVSGFINICFFKVERVVDKACYISLIIKDKIVLAFLGE